MKSQKLRPLNKKQLYELICTAKGEAKADIYITDGTVINVYTGELIKTNVAIKGRHIAYTGNAVNMVGDETKVFNAAGMYLCPGYIEPHAHPFQTYNPVTLAEKAMTLGTTTLICDSLFFFNNMDEGQLIKLWQELAELPVKILWGVRLDPQTYSPQRMEQFSPQRIEPLLEKTVARQAGELTDWPSLIAGREQMLDNMIIAGKLGKRVEGHAPGASAQTLNTLTAGGVTACHESITGEEVLQRLRLGLYATLRHSSLRPDLPKLLKDLLNSGADLRRTMITTDGTTPPTIKFGFTDYVIHLAIESGLPPVEAYRMATINPATYYGLENELGGIAPGRLADILFLEDPANPKPVKVLTEGILTAEKGEQLIDLKKPKWQDYNITSISAYPVKIADIVPPASDNTFPVIQFISPAITKRRDHKLPVQGGAIDLSGEHGLIYATLLDHMGEWVCNGIMSGFANDLAGMACSNTYSGDIAVLGRNPEEMLRAACRMFDIGGGVVVADSGHIIFELPLTLGGMMSEQPLDKLISKSDELYSLLAEKGHVHYDLLYTLHFLSATHLPDIRLSPHGILAVKEKKVLVPARKVSA